MTKPKEMINIVANDIINKGIIDWPTIKGIYGKEVEVTDTFLNVWSTYTINDGIEIQRSAEPEHKLILVIHEYRHFYKGESGNYTLLDESVDEDVKSDIKYLLQLIKKQILIYRLVWNLGGTLDFEKMFDIK